MSLLFVDTETYWDSDYSLRKMPTAQYIRDPRFELQVLVAYELDTRTTHFFNAPFDTGKNDQIRALCRNKTIVAHNAAFDVGVLEHHFGIYAKHIICTQSLARYACGLAVSSLSLALLPTAINLPERKLAQGQALVDTKGLRWADMTEDQRKALTAYCYQDVDVLRALMSWISKPPEGPYRRVYANGVKMQEHCIRAAVYPHLYLSVSALTERLLVLEDDRRRAIAQARGLGLTSAIMGSNPKFVDWLKQNGMADEDIPRKVSPATREETYALAASDEHFRALTAHENPVIAQGVGYRLQYKADFERKRVEAYRNYALAVGHDHDLVPWPVGLNWCGAMTTTRMSGNSYGGGNPQNLTRGSALRGCIQVPQGRVILAGDSKQLELRVGLYFAGYADDVKFMHEGGDLYQRTADANNVTRHVGKTIELLLLYQGGAQRLRTQIHLAGVPIKPLRSQILVDNYRENRKRLVEIWEDLRVMLHGQLNPVHLAQGFSLRSRVDTIKQSCAHLHIDLHHKAYEHGPIIPDVLVYPEFHRGIVEGMGIPEYTYRHSKGRSRLYSGKLWQNFVQSMAYRIIEQQALAFNKLTGLPLSLVTHDEIVTVCPEQDAKRRAAELQACLSLTPKTFPGLLLGGEVGYARNYKDAKS